MPTPAQRRAAAPEAWQQAHVDIGALAQRVTGLENVVEQIRGAISDLSKKLDGKPTNWLGIIGAQVGVLTVVGAAMSMLLSSRDASIDRHEREITRILETAVNRTDYLRDSEQKDHWMESLRDRIRFNEDRGVFKDDLDRVDKTIAKLADAMATRSDLTDDAKRTDERINSLATGLNDLRREVYSLGSAHGAAPTK